MAGAKAITRNGLNQPTAVNSVATSSDPRGNLTFDGVKGFTFDTANRLTGASSSTLSYDPPKSEKIKGAPPTAGSGP